MTSLPLFPLPNVVLFPGVPLPLHIFEPRYREMIADALAGDRRLAMVLLQAGWESDYDGRPPIYPIACSGVIVHSAKLEDGRYNVVLQGLERIRIVDEDHQRPYRRATVESLPDPPASDADRDVLRELREQLAPSASERLSSMPDADFIHAFAHAVDLEPLEKQALLECPSLRARAQALVELLEMRKLAAQLPPMRTS